MCLKHSVSAYTMMRWSLVCGYTNKCAPPLSSLLKKVQKMRKEYLRQNSNQKVLVARCSLDIKMCCNPQSTLRIIMAIASPTIFVLKFRRFVPHQRCKHSCAFSCWVRAVATELFTRIAIGHSMPFDLDTTQNTLMQRKESMVCKNHAHDIKRNRVRSSGVERNGHRNVCTTLRPFGRGINGSAKIYIVCKWFLFPLARSVTRYATLCGRRRTSFRVARHKWTREEFIIIFIDNKEA